MRGHFDDNFFDSINEVFICLVCSAMRHCLKAWTTGVYAEPGRNADFKYETTASKCHTSDVAESKVDEFRNIQKIPRNVGCTRPPNPAAIAVNH
jgi:hypothetical protein